MNWANVLTTVRLLLIVPITLAVLANAQVLAVTLYSLAALTDFFDGRVARKYGLASEWGAKYDGGVDIIFSVATFPWLMLLFPQRAELILLGLLVVMTFQVLVAAVSLGCKGRIVSLHLQLGRVATAMFFFVFPVMVMFGYLPVLFFASIALLVVGKMHTAWHLLRN